MSTDKTTSNLQINVMRRSQYDAIDNPSDDQLYFVEYDDKVYFVKSAGEEPPENPSEGDQYLNTDDNLIYTYTNGSWGEGETPSEGTTYVESVNNEIYVYDGTELKQIGGSGKAANVDTVTTSLNIDNQIQTIGVIDKNSGNPKYDWMGTKQEYDALGTYNSNWIYYIVDDNSPTGNISLTNVFNRLNAAYAWINNGTVVYTVPSPVEGYKTYSDATNMTVSSTITAYVEDVSITDGTGTYTRDTADDTVFGEISPDTKNQFLTVYDMLKAIKG